MDIRAFLKNQKQSFMSGDQNVAVFNPHGNIEKKLGFLSLVSSTAATFCVIKRFRKKYKGIYDQILDRP